MRAYYRTTLFISAAATAALAGALPAMAADSLIPTNVSSIFAVAAPPAGFDALHASDADLAAYKLPPRPDAATDPRAFAKWQRAMSFKTNRIAASLQSTNIYHGPAHLRGGTAGVKNTASSYNWSGAVNLNTLTAYSAKKSIYYLLSDYVIPQVTNATCDGTWDYSSQWVGIDGWGSGDVLQGGTEADAYCSGGSTSTYYSAWIEWYPYSETRISLPVAPGDDMFLEVWDTSSTVGYAYLANLSTGQTVEYELTPPSGTSLIGNSAEWIVERPGVNGGLATLSDYTLDYFSGAYARNFQGNTYLPGSKTSFLVNMLDNSGNATSDAYLLGTGALEFVYQ